MLSDDDIRALREALADGPTPGPWTSMLAYMGEQCIARINHHEAVPPKGVELAHESIDARYIAAASPDRIARLLDEVERLRGALAKANAQAEHFEREWYLRGDEIERLRAGRNELEATISNALPGVRYMDPPDGGSPSLAEQLLRMAEDAERYLWLRENTYGVAPEPTPTVPHIVHIGSSSDWRSALDDAIDAARGTKPAKGE